jgi:prepilin-type processing-associated H-X9-DG protein
VICPGFAVGTKGVNTPFPPHSGVPSRPVNGPWLNNRFDHLADSPWFTYGRLSSIRAPGPAMLWVLVDEDVHGLNDAAFAGGMEAPFWFDAPGTYHNGGCGFAFADGHSESHRWASPRPKRANASLANPQDYRDWLWMCARTSANISGAMMCALVENSPVIFLGGQRARITERRVRRGRIQFVQQEGLFTPSVKYSSSIEYADQTDEIIHEAIRRAIDHAGRPMVLSLSPGETPLADNFFDVYPGIPYEVAWRAAEPPVVLHVGNLV